MSPFNQGNTKASKLTAVQVLDIRTKYAARTHNQRQLSKLFQVSIGTISNIVHGVTWQNVTMIEPQEEKDYAAAQSERLLLELLQDADTPGTDINLGPDLKEIKRPDPYAVWLEKAKRGELEIDTAKDMAGLKDSSTDEVE